jgi:hypothetical protein
LFLAKIGVGERREVNHRFGSGARQEIEDAIVCEIPPNVVRRIGERPATDGNHLVPAEEPGPEMAADETARAG